MATGIGGKRLVVGLYLVIVCFTGVAGYLTAGVVDEITAPRFLLLIEFPATRLGLAAYGALTIAVVLGVLLWLVTVVSERVDDASPGTATANADAAGSGGGDDHNGDSSTAGTTDASEASDDTEHPADETRRE